MALVVINGTYLSASLKKSEFEGKVTYSVQLDVYQNESPSRDKMVTIKVEDAALLETFQKTYKMGDPISTTCTVAAYKNDSYFKYVS
jgi:hypothetical protein